MKRARKHATVFLLVFMILLCGTATVFGDKTFFANVDEDIRLSGLDFAGQPGLKFNSWNGESISLVTAADGKADEFKITVPYISDWKGHLVFQYPFTFDPDQDGQKVTIYEARLKMQCNDVEKKPYATFFGRAIATNGSTSIQVGEPVLSRHIPEGQWYEAKYVINHQTRQFSEFINGKLTKTWAFDATRMSEFRFYVNTRNSSNTGAEGEPLETPVEYIFDYFRVYQMGAYSIESVCPEDESIGIPVEGDIHIEFNTDMNIDTLNVDNIEVYIVGESGRQKVDTAKYSVTVIDPKHCRISYVGFANSSTYQIVITSRVKDFCNFYSDNVSMSFRTAKKEFNEKVKYGAVPMTLMIDGQASDVLKPGLVSGMVNITNENSSSVGIVLFVGTYFYDAHTNAYGTKALTWKEINLTPGENAVTLPNITVPDGAQYSIKVFPIYQEQGWIFANPLSCHMGEEIRITDE